MQGRASVDISFNRIQSLEKEANDLVQEWNCRRLWGAVLKQAILDLEVTPDRALSRPWERVDHATIDFFDTKNESFVQICKVLGFEPTEIIERVRGKNDINQTIQEVSVQPEEIPMKEDYDKLKLWKEELKKANLPKSAKLVGMMLADYYVPGKLTFPKQLTLAIDCGISERTVRIMTEALVSSSLVITKKIRIPDTKYEKIVFFFKNVNDHLLPQIDQLIANSINPSGPNGNTSAPADSTGVNSTPVKSTPVNSTSVDSTPANSTGVTTADKYKDNIINNINNNILRENPTPVESAGAERGHITGKVKSYDILNEIHKKAPPKFDKFMETAKKVTNKAKHGADVYAVADVFNDNIVSGKYRPPEKEFLERQFIKAIQTFKWL